ncbi:thiolase family protein [Thermoflavimicrobium dichotomicum]|uniref:acetyl-CoA C-acetyltransferase n=1 Tax=Thermoflavimicrobium dichotomicum TaxID=46223 RepID=A0A1I3SBX2_9BACL|nr:thiolase family protein [Thermoflavimicrobium dichotomicum]SFJ55051.1 acetyl-CoA C-acetyltransferase [Thermoflavimicrobium dichotomicum]
MSEVVIVSATRTAIGKYGGTLASVNPEDLAETVIQSVLKRADISPELVDAVILGHVRSTSRANNIARVATLKAKLPISAHAYTVNMLCGSGMQAIHLGMNEIRLGEADIVIAGGTENMSQSIFYLRNVQSPGHTPELVDANVEGGPGSQPIEIYGRISMGQTAENVAEKYGISREDQDRFAYESQMKAKEALETGRFKDEITPVAVQTKKERITFEIDEFPRPNTTLEKLASLPPVFKENGTVTAGNSCGRNDGAAAVLLMSLEKAKELGIKPLARIVAFAAAGVEPAYMGIGPVPATQKVLERSGLSLDDIDLIELNEAFASQSLACIRELNLDLKKVNVNGGAIALGHPLGCTGTRLVVTLLHEMRRRGSRYGLATQCIGGGQGVAMIIENLY